MLKWNHVSNALLYLLYLRPYCKVPKFSNAKNFAVIHLKFKQRGQTLKGICQNGANGIANSEDPDQTAPQSDLGLHCLPRPICPKF